MQAEKTIVYVSRASFSLNGAAVPIGLSTIHRKSNRANQERGVSGMLSFRKGRYIQLIEGPQAEVDELFQKICSDPRHHRIQVLVNQPISARMYPGTGMKLVISPHKEAQLRALVQAADLNNVSNPAKQFISSLFATRATTRVMDKDPSKQLYSMRGWPDFSRITPTPELIEFCSILNREQCRYQDLLSMNIFHSREALDANLLNLERLGFLQTKEIVLKAAPPAYTTAKNTGTSSSFFQRMTSFLGLSGA